MIAKLHAIIGNELKELFVLPCGIAHETLLPSQLAGPTGDTVPTTKVLLHLHSGEKITIEESMADLERIYNED